MLKPRKPCVIVESPFASAGRSRAFNVEYARAAMLDSLRRGEAPMLSHLLYTQVLDDHAPDERRLGIEAGLAWAALAQTTAVYEDLGLSPGVEWGIKDAIERGRGITFRALPDYRDFRPADLEEQKIEVLQRVRAAVGQRAERPAG